MAFVELPEQRGLLYVPDRRPGRGKHACPGCHVCQECGDDRCLLCRGPKAVREAPPEEKPFAEK